MVKEESAGPLGAIRECEDEEIHMCGAVQSDLGAMIVVADGRETQNICMASGKYRAVSRRGLAGGFWQAGAKGWVN